MHTDTDTVDAAPTADNGPAAPAAPADTAPADIAADEAAGMALPTWFFGFEGVLAGTFDILKAYPALWPALVGLAVVNITLSFTVMRKRLRLAKALWRGKGTRKVAFALLALRLGSHFALSAVGVAVTTTLGHLIFALVMAVATVGLLAYTQRIALRALEATRA